MENSACSFSKKVTWWICISVVAIFICFKDNSLLSNYAFTTFVIPPSFLPLPSSSSSSQLIEEGLTHAPSAMPTTASVGNTSANSGNGSPVLVYRNPKAFYKSYREMQKKFKVYVYEEGDPPVFHDGPFVGKYISEGRFIQEMERGDQRFRTRDPLNAQAYFMPFSVKFLRMHHYKPDSHDRAPLQEFVSDYVNLISTKHPYWNKSQGADHFMVACHDWGPHVSKGNELLYNTSIRVLCNANISEGFNPQKDVTLPQINLPDGEIPPELRSLPNSTNPRPYLAFFAGKVHGPVRPLLLSHWKGRELPEMQVFEFLPPEINYFNFLLKSRFCLCPSGYEVSSPRLVEAIYAQCVPVIISKNYVPPFNDVLKWETFSLSVEVSDIPRLKEMLTGVSEDEYKRLKKGVKMVRKHFVFNQQPKKFDAFHMILYSIWLKINAKLV